MINDTHDTNLKSWVESANDPWADFPIQNLPLGVFSHNDQPPRVGAAIGDQILDLYAAGLYEGDTLLPLMRQGVTLRREIQQILKSGSPMRPEWLVPIAQARMLPPCAIGDYTDFYASIEHATAIGKLLRPENPLLPNYKYVPIAYHGRASSIVVSPAPVMRPLGQLQEGTNAPRYGPTQKLDYELELGFFIGRGNALGQPIPIAQAEAHLFGFCLVNDWSARDIQRWEYQPLGPFLSKSFATSISPWVVTAEALAPFRSRAPQRPPGDPLPLPHLSGATEAYDVTLEVWLNDKRMATVNAAHDLYWTPAQMIAHHTSNGCNLRPGDLIATGTISGPANDARGCLLERTGVFLSDGDEVTMRGWCERGGFRRVGFGECRGKVLPALKNP
jgi:fumarylacetoacetase